MPKTLTPRQQAALDKINAQGGTFAGIDRGMIQALRKKGHLGNEARDYALNTSVVRPRVAQKPRQVGYTAAQQACLDAVEAAYRAAEAHYGVEIKRIPVSFSTRLTKTAGKVFFNRVWDEPNPTKMVLSTQILELNEQEFIARTPGHEAAHVIAMQIFKHDGHLSPWKEVMRVIGLEPTRTHSMKTPKQSGSLYVASCGTEFTFSRKRHQNLQSGRTSLTVNSTQGKISAQHFVRYVSA